MTRAVTAALAACTAAMGILPFSLQAAAPTPGDIEAMQGTWAIESLVLDGNSVAKDQLTNWRRIVEGHHVTWKNGDQTLVELEIEIDPSQTPMALDSTIVSGESKGKVLVAIYELQDDELRVCFANPDRHRPTEFSSEPGSGQSLYTAKRIKP